MVHVENPKIVNETFKTVFDGFEVEFSFYETLPCPNP